jgi:hypothetical protein
VRAGLLFVCSGGINRVYRPTFPASLGVVLALVIELDEVESERPHELDVRVLGEDGRQVANVKGAFEVNAPERRAGEHVHVPVVVDFRDAHVPEAGTFDVRVYLDGNHRRTLTFRAELPPGCTAAGQYAGLPARRAASMR